MGQQKATQFLRDVGDYQTSTFNSKSGAKIKNTRSITAGVSQYTKKCTSSLG